MKRARAFTLVELLVVMAIMAILAALLLRVLHRGHDRAKAVSCLGNLRQWGVALQFYTMDHANYLPPEGKGTPLEKDLGNPRYKGWYIQLPDQAGLPRYADMPWRTNPLIVPGKSIWICPANVRRCNASSKTNNLFHYCLNENLDGTDEADCPTQITTIRHPSTTIHLFDSKNLPAVGGWTFVHTNLHNRGAQFLFLDGHAARFRNTDYWNFKQRRAITDNPTLVWKPD